MDPALAPSSATVQTPPTDEMQPHAKKAARAAFFGFAVDYFDIYLPVVALAPAMHYFQPHGLSGTVQTTLFYISFAVTLLGRPIGATIFGHLSDQIGRRKSTLIAVAGFSLATLLIATLPGYQSWGLGSFICLVALRLIGGTFMGGEYTSANPLAMELCPQEKRGVVGAFVASAYPIGYIAISMVTLPILMTLPQSDLSSPYAQWGWRIPFLFGGALGAIFFCYFYRSVGESPVWTHAKDEKSSTATATAKPPISQLLTGTNLRRFVQVFTLMSGLWFAIQAIISPMSGILIEHLHKNSSMVTVGLMLANVALFIGYLIIGRAGQKWGRRKLLLIYGSATATVSAVAFYITVPVLSSGGSFTGAMLVYAVCLVIAISPMGLATVYLLESFPTTVRATGYGVAFSTSLIIPSFYSFYMLGLAHVMPYVYTPIVLIVISGILTVLGALLGPETKDVEFV